VSHEHGVLAYLPRCRLNCRKIWPPDFSLTASISFRGQPYVLSPARTRRLRMNRARLLYNAWGAYSATRAAPLHYTLIFMEVDARLRLNHLFAFSCRFPRVLILAYHSGTRLHSQFKIVVATCGHILLLLVYHLRKFQLMLRGLDEGRISASHQVLGAEALVVIAL